MSPIGRSKSGFHSKLSGSVCSTAVERWTRDQELMGSYHRSMSAFFLSISPFPRSVSPRLIYKRCMVWCKPSLVCAELAWKSNLSSLEKYKFPSIRFDLWVCNISNDDDSVQQCFKCLLFLKLGVALNAVKNAVSNLQIAQSEFLWSHLIWTDWTCAHISSRL